MKTYLANGTIGDVKYIIDDFEEFQIQELDIEAANRYIYPGDAINYTLDSELVKLYDVLRDLYFDDLAYNINKCGGFSKCRLKI